MDPAPYRPGYPRNVGQDRPQPSGTATKKEESMRTASATAILSALLAIGLSRHAAASLAVTGPVTPGSVVPIVQPPISPIGELLKIRLEVPNDSILLCLGTFNDIFSTPPKCGQSLGDPVGPGGRAG